MGQLVELGLPVEQGLVVVKDKKARRVLVVQLVHKARKDRREKLVELGQVEEQGQLVELGRQDKKGKKDKLVVQGQPVVLDQQAHQVDLQQTQMLKLIV